MECVLLVRGLTKMYQEISESMKRRKVVRDKETSVNESNIEYLIS